MFLGLGQHFGMFWGISGHHGDVLGWYFEAFQGGLLGHLGTFWDVTVAFWGVF